jgi:HSP20 family protein
MKSSIVPALHSSFALPSLFDDFVNSFFDENYTHDAQLMPLDVVEKENSFEVKANFPGLKKENIKLSVKDRELVIEARHEAEQQEDQGVYHLKERYIGAWHRSIRLPENCDVSKIAAKLEDGVLLLTIPKSDPKPKTQIPIE